MTKTSKYGNLPTETNNLIVAAEGLDVNDYRLLFWLVRFVRRGDKLASYEHAILNRWLESTQLLIQAKDVHTVQFTERQAGTIFGKGGANKTTARNHIGKLVSRGLLLKVGSSSKGHAQLFALKRCFAAVHIGHLCEQSKNLVVMTDGVCGHSKGVCGHSDPPANCSDAAYPILSINYPIADGIAPSVGTGEPPRCPKCGGKAERIAAGWLCPACMNVFK